MGTAVLSPQDCLVSPHSRHDHRLKDMVLPSSPKTPKSGRNALQAAAMQSGIPSIASGRARWNSSGATCNASEIDVLNRFNDSPGLLPAPVTRLDSRHSSLERSSFTSFSSTTSSTVSSRSRQLATYALSSPGSRIASSPAPTSSSKSTRSVSVGLLASRGSQASAAGESVHRSLIPSNEGVPFKMVQNNSMVDRVAYEFETVASPVRRRDLQSSKFLDGKRGFHEKRIVGCEYVGDLRKRTHADFVYQQGLLEREGLALSRSASSEEGGGTNGLRRDAEGKKIGKRRETDRGFSGKEVLEKDVGRTQLVTILQRPKDKDAAVELIVRFFKKAEAASVKEGFDLEVQTEESKADNPIQSMVNGYSLSNEHTEMNVSKRTLKHKWLNGIPNIENVSHFPERLAVCEDHLTIQNRGSLDGTALIRQRSMDSQRMSCHHHAEVMDAPLPEIKEDVGFGEISKYIASIFGDDKWLPMFCNERWAGPAFTNSPPPSSLPLPKFPMKPFRTTPRSSCIQNQSVADTLHHPSAGQSLASVLPSRRSVSFNGRSPGDGQEGACDIAFATKDLRRMLNLDAS